MYLWHNTVSKTLSISVCEFICLMHHNHIKVILPYHSHLVMMKFDSSRRNDTYMVII